jgi:hypothetical protein
MPHALLGFVAPRQSAPRTLSVTVRRSDIPTTSAHTLSRLFVCRVFAAESAELLVLDPAGLLLLVLRGRVVPSLTLGTFQRNDVSHGISFLINVTFLWSLRPGLNR